MAVSSWLATLAQPTPAAAAQAFSQTAFDKARTSGRPIVVESYADWCPPCQIQEPALERLQAQTAFRNLVVFHVGERTPPAVWGRFGLYGYGVLIVFEGQREVGRGTPVTETAVAALVRKAHQPRGDPKSLASP